MGKILRYCCSFFVILLAILAYIIIDALQVFKSMPSIGNEKCHIHSKVPANFEGPEDMVKYDKFLIFAATNHLKLYEVKTLNPSKIQGNLFLLYPNETVEVMPLENYPVDQLHRFKPFSINVLGSNLYVLNEDYEGGNDRIEVFEISKTKEGGLAVKFLYFITFEENFLGMLNNFALLDKNEFFITTWMPWPDPTYGRADSRNFWNNMLKLTYWMLGIKKTYIYYCIGVENKNASCIKVKNTEGVMNNGLYLDKPNKLLYVGKTLERKVSVFQLKEENQPENSLIHTKDIELPCCPDNLDYDHENQRIIVGCTGRSIDHLKIIHYSNQLNGSFPEDKELWYGIVSIHKDQTEILFMNDTLFRGIAGGMRLGDKMYIGSFCENRLMVCDF